MTMNSPNKDNSPERLLERALQRWEVKHPLPPRFQEQVWRRIEKAETETPAAFWALLTGWIAQALTRRSVAVSYVMLLLLTGLLAGYWQARVEKTRTVESLSARYVQMVDPYQTR
jgi:hypothetical protein